MVKFSFTDEEIQQTKDILIGLASNLFFSCLFKDFDKQYEDPIDIIKKSNFIYNAGFFTRNLLKIILTLSGNTRMVRNLKYMTPLTN
jgi:hypothetical protein